MDDRLLRLKRWLHRTKLGRYSFCDALNSKRQKELIQIAKGDSSELQTGQLPTVPTVIGKSESRRRNFREHGNSLLEWKINDYYYLVLCYDFKMRIPYGWISCDPTNPYSVNPEFWLKFTGWPDSYLERLIEALPGIAAEWIREDKYISQEFVKIEKIQAIRNKVKKLREQRENIMNQ